MTWWLGKNAGVPQGTWKGMGKKLGIGLSDEEKVARDTERRIQGGQATPQEQLEIVSGRMDTSGVRGDYDVVNPGAARHVNRYASGKRAQGRMDEQGEIRGEQEGAPAWAGPNSKPIAEWTSDEVKEMQMNLNDAGFVDDKGEKLKLDGMVGPRTVAAMRNAQASRKLEGDYTGQRGDYSDARKGFGGDEDRAKNNLTAGDPHVAIQRGARSPVYGTGDVYTPGGAATEETFAPSWKESAKNVFGDWASGKEGWIPDRWQGK